MWSYLWQNFLIDSKIRTYIAERIQRMYQDLGCAALIEIGPWKGSITTLISHISENFFVIEKDSTFIENWKLKIENWKFVLGDVLEVDVEKMLEAWGLMHDATKKTLVVGNLPYYITSPILRKFFTQDGRRFDPEDSRWSKGRFAGWIFMLQDEVGQKLRWDAKKKSYLRWLINYAYQVTYLKWVPGKCFKPIPKVKSCLVELHMRNDELKIGRDKLIQFLDMFAPFSRKTLGAIRTMVNKKSGCVFVIPEDVKKKRLEELSFEELEEIIA